MPVSFHLKLFAKRQLRLIINRVQIRYGLKEGIADPLFSLIFSETLTFADTYTMILFFPFLLFFCFLLLLIGQ